MAYYLSEIYPQLESTEQRRIQRRLGCILSQGIPPLRLRELISRAFEGLPSISQLFSYLQVEPLLSQMLASFGALSPDRISEEERTLLAKIPGLAFWKGRIPFLCAEALERLLVERPALKDGLFFGHLVRLSSRERQALKQWILPNDLSPISGKSLAALLYTRIAELRSQPIDSPLAQTPSHFTETNYLDEIWPDDPAQNRVAWFYRGILPLYTCLFEEEKRLRESTTEPAARERLHWILLFKTGRIFAKAEAPETGKPTRYRIHHSFETQGHTLYRNASFPPPRPESEQGLLFY